MENKSCEFINLLKKNSGVEHTHGNCFCMSLLGNKFQHNLRLWHSKCWTYTGRFANTRNLCVFMELVKSIFNLKLCIVKCIGGKYSYWLLHTPMWFFTDLNNRTNKSGSIPVIINNSILELILWNEERQLQNIFLEANPHLFSKNPLDLNPGGLMAWPVFW